MGFAQLDSFRPSAYSECVAVLLSKRLGWNLPGSVVPRCGHGLLWIHTSEQNRIFPGSMQQTPQIVSAAVNRNGKHIAMLESKICVRELGLVAKHADSSCRAARQSHTPCCAAGQITASR